MADVSVHRRDAEDVWTGDSGLVPGGRPPHVTDGQGQAGEAGSARTSGVAWDPLCRVVSCFSPFPSFW